jgi:hypothetical protein
MEATMEVLACSREDMAQVIKQRECTGAMRCGCASPE